MANDSSTTGTDTGSDGPPAPAPSAESRLRPGARPQQDESPKQPASGPSPAGNEARPQRSLALPDDEAGAARKRWLMGWMLIGAAAIVVISIGLPWIGAAPDAVSDPVPKQLYGFEWDRGLGAAIVAIGIGAYAWQAIGRSEMRFNSVAGVALLGLLWVTFTSVVTAQDAVVAELGATPQGSGSDGELSFVNAGQVEMRYGIVVAALASLVAIGPYAWLRRDAHRRKRIREASGLEGSGEQRTAAPPPPPPARA